MVNTNLGSTHLATAAHARAVSSLSLRYLRLSCGLYEPVVPISTPVYHVYVAGIGAGEDEEVVVEELHLEDRLLRAHRLHLELLGADYPGLDLFFLFDDERLRLDRRLEMGALDLAVPAVDLAPPVAPHLALELVRHAVYGGVHVLRRLTRLQDRPVDEQRRLGHLGLRDGRIALVRQLHLRPRSAALVVEELGDALDLLEGVPLEGLRHRDVAPLDGYLHVASFPFGAASGLLLIPETRDPTPPDRPAQAHRAHLSYPTAQENFGA